MVGDEKQPEDISEEITRSVSADPKPVEPDQTDEYEDEMPTGPSRWQQLRSWYVAYKQRTIPATVVIAIALVFVIPMTRYGLLGVFVRRSVQLTVLDDQTHIPVSSIDVAIGNK